MALNAARMGNNLHIVPAWRQGKIIIIGMLEAGPDAGRCVTSSATRSLYLGLVEKFRSEPPERDFLRYVKRSIWTGVLRGMRNFDPEKDQAFYSALTIYLAISDATGKLLLHGTGLFSLGLLIDDDQSLPWDQRGFLSAENVMGILAFGGVTDQLPPVY